MSTDGHPCDKSCCEKPEPGGLQEWECDRGCAPDHCWCDENWMTECANCGAQCACDV